jgi:N-acetylglucosamine kinase-like BadF-type ATPase
MPRIKRLHEEPSVPRYYLGIDGGQSSTVALIADHTGRVLGRGVGGPCNHVAADEAAHKFKTVIGACIEQACAEAELAFQGVQFAAACLGFSGGAEDKEAYSRALIRSKLFRFSNDAEIALSGATAGAPGIVVIAGTGSIAFGRSARGVTGRAGGWGYVFGDEGGAFDLTRRALRAALQFEEGWGPATALREMLLAATQSANANSLLHRFYTAEYPRAKVATLAHLVDGAAQAGDEVATHILDQAASKLAWLVQGVYRKLFKPHESATVSYTGGVFQSKLLRDSFSNAILQSIGCTVVPPQLSPAAGAVLEALKLDGNESQLSGMPDSAK